MLRKRVETFLKKQGAQPPSKEEWSEFFLNDSVVRHGFEWVDCINKAGENKTYPRKIPRGQKRLDRRG